jgi:hypothetical protein
MSPDAVKFTVPAVSAVLGCTGVPANAAMTRDAPAATAAHDMTLFTADSLHVG